MKRELLLGCGSRINKDLYLNNEKEFENVFRVDSCVRHNVDLCLDLRHHPLVFEDESFDEIHAYEVLEHLADQGDYEFFFREFSEYYRILKPGGHFFASVPLLTSPWAWGDPSHKRVISRETLTFLSQEEYEKQVGITKMSDFRHIYKANFKTIFMKEHGDSFYFILKKI